MSNRNQWHQAYDHDQARIQPNIWPWNAPSVHEEPFWREYIQENSSAQLLAEIDGMYTCAATQYAGYPLNW